MNKDEMKSCRQLNKKASLVNIASQINTAVGKKVASTAITTTFTIVNTNVQPQFQSVKSKRKQAEKQEHLISYR